MTQKSTKTKPKNMKKRTLLLVSTIFSILLFCSVLSMAVSESDSHFISSIASFNITSTSVASSSATISWTTNENATTQIDYGTDENYSDSTALDSTLVTSHSQAISGLSASTLYHYRVRSEDAAKNVVISPDQTFTTVAPPDIIPPTISFILSSDLASSSANISWITDEDSDTQVEYGINNSYGYSTTLNTSLTTSHSQAISGLSTSTTYHYRVKSKDAAGNLAISPDQTFTTSGPDPSFISAILVSDITSSNATISWTTHGASDTQVEYGTTTSYGSSTTLNTSLITSHSQVISGLSTSTTYHYRVKSKDAAENLATSADQTFTTSGPDSGVVASWKFDENKGKIATDSSGNNNGTINGATWTAGKVGSALSFDGVANYVKIGADTKFDFGGGDYSISAYIKTSDTEGTIVRKFDTMGAGSGLNFGVYNGKLSVYTYGSKLSVDTNIINNNVWHNVVLTRSAGHHLIYIDGVYKNDIVTNTGSVASHGKNLYVGGPLHIYDPVSFGYLDGSIDEVKIYNYALSHSEILAAYNDDLSADTTPTTISAISSSDIASSSATISWTTNEASDTKVEYGTTTDYGFSTTLNTSLITSHSQDLAGLSASTLYHYRVKSKDAAGNLATSADQTFTTPGPDSGLIASWKFDENKGKIATDSSGNGSNGIINGATWVTGINGSALSFDGVDDYVDFGNPTKLQLTNEMSMVGWIKINNLTEYAALFGRGVGETSGGNYGYYLTYKPTGYIYFDTHNQAGKRDWIFAEYPQDNDWHYIVATWDGTKGHDGKKLYIDGAIVKLGTSTLSSIGNNTFNFTAGIDSNGYHPGNISLDEIKMYNYALTPSEIHANYYADSGYEIPAHYSDTIWRNPTGNPMGGGAGYTDIISPADADYYIQNNATNLTDFIAALAAVQPGEIIYIDDDVEMNITSYSPLSFEVLEPNVTIASGRGNGSSQGAHIYTRYSVTEEGREQYNNMFRVYENDVRITGLRLDGGNYGTDRGGKTLQFGITMPFGNPIEIDNNELYGFGYTAIYFISAPENSTSHIHHNYIHNNANDGYGYGISIVYPAGNNTNVLIEGNHFENNRHAISSTGDARMNWEARYNYVGSNGGEFDVHGNSDNPDHFGGGAGNTILIYGNTFNCYAVSIRGVPYNIADVYDNYFASYSYVNQVDFEGRTVIDGNYINMTVHDNCNDCIALTSGT